MNVQITIHGDFLDFCNHFAIFFEIYSVTVQEIYYEKRFTFQKLLFLTGRKVTQQY